MSKATLVDNFSKDLPDFIPLSSSMKLNRVVVSNVAISVVIVVVSSSHLADLETRKRQTNKMTRLKRENKLFSLFLLENILLFDTK